MLNQREKTKQSSTLVIALAFITLTSCSYESDKPYIVEEYRLSDIYLSLKDHLGERARIIGYLFSRSDHPDSPNLVLLGAEYESKLNVAYTHRYSLWLDYKEVLKNKKALYSCVGHYVVITGKIGYANISQSFTIESIEAVLSIEEEHSTPCFIK